MWPEKEFDHIKLADDDIGKHYGLYKGNHLIAVASLFINEGEAQFRKFATLPQEQRNGYGSTLLEFIIREAEEYNIKRIWCNARIEKADFYRKFGLNESNMTFIKEDKTYVIMERFL